METIRQEYKGILFALGLGLLAYFTAPVLSLNGVLLSFALGIVVGNFLRIPEHLRPGASWVGSHLIEVSILLLAFSIDYKSMAALGWKSFAIIAITLVVVLVLSIYLSKKFQCPGSTGWLVGFGTAICGSAAIAALSPSVSKNKNDVGIAMAVVHLIGNAAMVVMPAILLKTGLTYAENGLLIGGSLHSVGNVAGAGYAVDRLTGDASVTIKLARVAMLSPMLILFTAIVNREQNKPWREYLQLPWYLWGFLAITIAVSFVSVPEYITDVLDGIGKVMLTVAMAAIGLNISLHTLYISGRKGMAFGLVIFAVQVGMLLLLMRL